jgi:hypothetical protein
VVAHEILLKGLKLTVEVLDASPAVRGMTGKHKLHRETPAGVYLLAPGPDLHALPDGRRARGGKTAHALYFNDAQPADAARGKIGVMAEMRDIDAPFEGSFKDAPSLLRLNRATVYDKLHRFQKR